MKHPIHVLSAYASFTCVGLIQTCQILSSAHILECQSKTLSGIRAIWELVLSQVTRLPR